MTKLLEKAFKAAAKLPSKEQNALARTLLDEVEDYLELHDPKVRREIQKSNEEYLAGRTRPFEDLLSELPSGKSKKIIRVRPARRAGL